MASAVANVVFPAPIRPEMPINRPSHVSWALKSNEWLLGEALAVEEGEAMDDMGGRRTDVRRGVRCGA